MPHPRCHGALVHGRHSKLSNGSGCIDQTDPRSVRFLSGLLRGTPKPSLRDRHFLAKGATRKKREDNVQEPVKEATARTVGHARWYRALPCTHGRHARAPSVRARVTPHRCSAARTAFFQNARSRRRPDNRLGYLLMASTAGEDGRRIAEPV